MCPVRAETISQYGDDGEEEASPASCVHRRVQSRHRLRRPQFLSVSEREEISRGLAAGEPLCGIARRLGRSASTVCREVKRNKARRTTAPSMPTTGRGGELGDRNGVDWPNGLGAPGLWRASSSRTGHPSNFPAIWRGTLGTTWRCR